jgi:hypothetical protein
MFIQIKDGVPQSYTLGQLRRDNPTTSFPALIPDDILADFGVFRIHTKDVPDYDVLTQRLNKSNLYQEGGKWWRHYTIEHFPEDVAKQNVRDHRNSLIAETDWMALNDNNMSEDWAAYRQALRDITAQKGFPYQVTWPTKP